MTSSTQRFIIIRSIPSKEVSFFAGTYFSKNRAVEDLVILKARAIADKEHNVVYSMIVMDMVQFMYEGTIVK